MGLSFTIDMTWGRLILLSLSKKRPKKSISRHKGCRQMVIEPVHCGSSSILKVRFLGHPVYHDDFDHYHHFHVMLIALFENTTSPFL